MEYNHDNIEDAQRESKHVTKVRTTQTAGTQEQRNQEINTNS